MMNEQWQSLLLLSLFVIKKESYLILFEEQPSFSENMFIVLKIGTESRINELVFNDDSEL